MINVERSKRINLTYKCTYLWQHYNNNLAKNRNSIPRIHEE